MSPTVPHYAIMKLQNLRWQGKVLQSKVQVNEKKRAREKEEESEREEWGFSLPAKGVLGRSNLHTIRNKYNTM